MSVPATDPTRHPLGVLDLWAVSRLSDEVRCWIAVFRDGLQTVHELSMSFNGSLFCRITHDSQEGARDEGESLLAGYLTRDWLLVSDRNETTPAGRVV